MRELRSADEARRFYADERARARADTAGDRHGAKAAAPPGAVASGAEGCVSDGKGRDIAGKRGSSSSNSGSSSNASRSRRRRRGAHAAAPGGALPNGRQEEPHRRISEGDLLRLRGDTPPPITITDGPTADAAGAAGSPLFSSPLPPMERFRSPSSARRGWKTDGRGDGRSGSSASSKSAGDAGAGADVTGAAGEGVPPPESGSLFELRDALRSREKELLRLKRDVAVVATSAGGFKHLAVSLGSSDTNASIAGRGSSFGFDRRGRRRHGAEEAGPPGSRPGPHGSSFLESGFGEDGASSVGGQQPSSVVEQEGALGDQLLPRSSFGSSFAGAASPNRATTSVPPPRADDELASPRQRMPPPPPRQQRQQPPTAALSGGAATLTAGGSPLVASAHEGLRQMRVVLEQRALEAERAKHDSKNLVSWDGSARRCGKI